MAVQTKAVSFSDLYPSFRKGFIEPALEILSAMKKAKPAAAPGKGGVSVASKPKQKGY